MGKVPPEFDGNTSQMAYQTCCSPLKLRTKLVVSCRNRLHNLMFATQVVYQTACLTLQVRTQPRLFTTQFVYQVVQQSNCYQYCCLPLNCCCQTACLALKLFTQPGC